MKSARNYLKWFFVLVLVAICLLFLQRPYLLKVLRYRTPNPDTYLAFPQAMVSPPDSVFFFKRAGKMRKDLDTVLVRNGENQMVSFSQYFKQGQLSAFMVIRNDSIIYEKFSEGFSEHTLTSVFSGAKSMVSIMIGQALDEGKIKSLEDLVTDYIPELKSNPAFARIRVKNLLDMQSGLEFKDALGGLIKAFFADETKVLLHQ
ncbi:serine hydrolase [Pedobacter sp. AW1-32]|uniref:serine hydrolase n=1 Tax=Pedobacter sp. AW1-32 TaxID=3383026 RepID=UPI003FF00FF6